MIAFLCSKLEKYLTMKTVNSLSGGKTSSYIAVHYPADYEIFALCCIESHNAGAHISRRMKQMVNDKLQKYCPQFPEFVATSEDPKVLKVMFDLEQMIGREIIWVRGIGWEDMIRLKKAIPNKFKRFCTSALKIQPIFEFLYKYAELPIQMRIGYRYDEIERIVKFRDEFKFAYKCQYMEKSDRWINRWKKINWRYGEFPLVENKIIYYHIQKYWKDKGIDFPYDSNCQNCFWKQAEQLRKNFETNAPIMYWAVVEEWLTGGHTFHDKLNMEQIGRLPLEQHFFYGTGSGCQAGFCTD